MTVYTIAKHDRGILVTVDSGLPYDAFNFASHNRRYLCADFVTAWRIIGDDVNQYTVKDYRIVDQT